MTVSDVVLVQLKSMNNKLNWVGGVA